MLWWERWINEKGHKSCEDRRDSGSEKETYDPCSAHLPQINWGDRDNIVRMLAQSENAAIAVTPIIEAAEL